jgi:hypothetical protein
MANNTEILMEIVLVLVLIILGSASTTGSSSGSSSRGKDNKETIVYQQQPQQQQQPVIIYQQAPPEQQMVQQPVQQSVQQPVQQAKPSSSLKNFAVKSYDKIVNDDKKGKGEHLSSLLLLMESEGIPKDEATLIIKRALRKANGNAEAFGDEIEKSL